MDAHRTVTAVKATIASVATGFSYLIGGFDIAIQTLVIFMTVDIITGVAVAILNENVESKVAWIGLTKKVMTFLVIIIAFSLDNLLGSGKAIRTFACYFYIANEGLSILENAGKIGFPFPENLTKILAQLKDSEKVDLSEKIEHIFGAKQEEKQEVENDEKHIR